MPEFPPPKLFPDSENRRPVLLATALGVFLGALVFGETGGFSSLDYDDPVMVIGNAVGHEGLGAESGYLSRLANTFWSSGLAPFYPHPEGLKAGQTVRNIVASNGQTDWS